MAYKDELNCNIIRLVPEDRVYCDIVGEMTSLVCATGAVEGAYNMC